MMMLKRRVSAGLVAVVVFAMAALAGMGWFVADQYHQETFTYVYYNDTSPAEHPNNNSGDVLDASLSTDILIAAPEEARKDPAGNVDWFVEDFVNTRIYDQEANSGDPTLLRQIAFDMMLRAPKAAGELLPTTEQSVEEAERTILRLLDNPNDHIQLAGKVQAILLQSTKIEVRKIENGYTSSAYMRRDGITLDAERAETHGRTAVPLPIHEKSNGVQGWEIVFTLKTGEVLSYRINCGYQPDTSNYPPSGSTPNYTPPDISIDIEDPTPSPKPNPSPSPSPGGSDPTPEPKDPDAGPQGQNPNNPDYGGGQNTDNNTELTTEPRSPSTYTPPSTPTPTAGDDKYDTPADNGNGIVENNQPDSSGKPKTDTITGENTGETVTGDVDVGTPNKDTLDDVQQSPPTAESGANKGAEETVDPPPPM